MTWPEAFLSAVSVASFFLFLAVLVRSHFSAARDTHSDETGTDND